MNRRRLIKVGLSFFWVRFALLALSAIECLTPYRETSVSESVKKQ